MDELYKSAGIWDRARNFALDWHDAAVVPMQSSSSSGHGTYSLAAGIVGERVPDVRRGLFRAQAQPQAHHTALNRLTVTNRNSPLTTRIKRMADPYAREQRVEELADQRPRQHQARQARIRRHDRYDYAQEDAHDMARNREKLDALRDDANNFMSEASRFAGESPVSAASPVGAVPPSGSGRFDHIDMSSIGIPSPSGDYLRSGSGRPSSPSNLDSLLRGPDHPSTSPRQPAAPMSEPPRASTGSSPTAAPTPIDDTRAAIEREIAQIRELQRRGDELDAQIRAGLKTSPDPASAVPPGDSPTPPPRASEGPASAVPPRAQGPGPSPVPGPGTGPAPSVQPDRPTSAAVPPTQGSSGGIDPRVWRYGVPTVAALGVGGGLAYNQLRDRPWYER